MCTLSYAFWIVYLCRNHNDEEASREFYRQVRSLGAAAAAAAVVMGLQGERRCLPACMQHSCMVAAGHAAWRSE